MTAEACRRRHAHCVLPPTFSPSYNLEYSVHEPPSILRKEIERTFPGVKFDAGLLVVPVFQPSQVDLITWGPEQEVEKDRCLEVFLEWGKRVCAALAERGFWADFTDPCTGLPYLGDKGNHIYSDVDGMQLVLRYATVDCGGCKLVSHPQWRTRVYPTTLFTTAPADQVLHILAAIDTDSMLTAAS